jgi:hypothetical protein
MASVGMTFVRSFAEEYDVLSPVKSKGVEYDITQKRWLSELGRRYVHTASSACTPRTDD